MYFSQFFLEYVVSFIVLIFVLVFIHEFGHFLFARLCGVKVECFSIGFGKELLGYTDKLGTRWKIAPIPLGGYVKMKGEMLSGKENLSNDTDSFSSKKLWQKSLIVFAGPLFNLLLPLVVFFIIPILFGVSDIKPKIKHILPESSAYKLLKPGDLVVSINNQKVSSFNELHNIISKLADKSANFVVVRNDSLFNLNINIGKKVINEKSIGFLGIEADTTAKFSKKVNFIDAMVMSGSLYKTTITNVLYGFKLLFTGKVGFNDIGGPIKIAQLSGEIVHKGIDRWLLLLGALSINLAIVNLVPIPALDGGYLFMYLVQFVIRKPIPTKLQYIVVTVGFFILLVLISLISFNDIVRLLI